MGFPDVTCVSWLINLAEGESYRSDRKIKHTAALIRMIRVLSGEPDADDIERWMEEQGIREEDEVTVCELFDQYVRQGRAEGKEEGRKEGETRFARLMQLLIDSGRSEDLKRAVSDENYRVQLYMEASLL